MTARIYKPAKTAMWNGAHHSTYHHDIADYPTVSSTDEAFPSSSGAIFTTSNPTTIPAAVTS